VEKVPQEKKINSVENIDNDEIMVIKEKKLNSIEEEIDNESNVIKEDL